MLILTDWKLWKFRESLIIGGSTLWAVGVQAEKERLYQTGRLQRPEIENEDL